MQISQNSFRLTLAFLAVLFFTVSSCKTKNLALEASNPSVSSCDTTKIKLAFLPVSNEGKWLDENPIKCNRINEFFRMFGYTNESIRFMKDFVKLKVIDEEYKLERFIELFCILDRNPNALIDGTLDKKGEN